MKICSFFAQIHNLQSDFIMKRTNVLVNSEDCLLRGRPTNLFNYSLCLALLQVPLRPPHQALHRQRPGTYTGQFVYSGRRTTLSIGDVPSLRRILEGAVICNIEHHTGDCGAPPPGHPGTTPSSSATTPRTASGRGMPAAEGKPPRTTARPTTLGTFRCPSSFNGGNPFSAKATRTISSTLDNL